MLAGRGAASGWSHLAAANTEQGAARLAVELAALRLALVVLEPTGGLEAEVVEALAAVGLPAALVNPRRVRGCARATGRSAKADALDAALPAEYAERLRPPARPRPSAALRALRALLVRRRQLVKLLTAERNRLRRAAAVVRDGLAAHIAWLERAVERLEAELRAALVACMRTLLTILNAVLRDRTPWQPPTTA